MKKILGISAVLWMFLSACGPDIKPENQVGTLELNFEANVAGQIFEKGQRYSYSNRYGWIDSLKFYVSNLKAIRKDGTDTLLAEILLFDYSLAGKTLHGSGVFESFDILVGEYQGVSFSLGVSPTLNHTNAVTYPSGHPLNSSNGMFWNTTDGYAFLMIKGGADSLNSATPTIPLAYYIGNDALLKPKSYINGDNAFKIVRNKEVQFKIQIDLSEVLNGIDIARTPTSYTLPLGSADYQRAEKIMDNFVTKSLFKVP